MTSEILMKGNHGESGEGEVAMNLRAYKIQMLIAAYKFLAITQQVVAQLKKFVQRAVAQISQELLWMM
jgi:hypothetical protein